MPLPDTTMGVPLTDLSTWVPRWPEPWWWQPAGLKPGQQVIPRQAGTRLGLPVLAQLQRILLEDDRVGLCGLPAACHPAGNSRRR